MSTQVSLFQGNDFAVPAYAQGGSDATNALGGGLTGEARNRIGLKGARFRLIQKGEEVAVRNEAHLDVVIVGSNPAVSRTYYAGEFDPKVKAPPTCYSSDGVGPAPDATEKQSSKCATCPQNVKGSKVVSGVKMRACGFSKRLVVALVGDPDNHLYQLDVKSKSLFGTGDATKHLFGLGEYSKFLASRGVKKIESVVTRLSFDTNESVPKLFFTPISFVGEADMAKYTTLATSDEVKKYIEVNATDVGDTGEAPPALPTFAPAAPAPAAAAPAAPAAPAPAPAKAAPAGATMDDLAALLGEEFAD